MMARKTQVLTAVTMAPMDERSGDLVARWREGDQQAAAQLFHRYAERLIALARAHLSSRLAPRVDAEDVVQSVYRCFFCEARAGRYEFQHGGDLWKLLVAMTFNKIRNQAKYHSCEKRSLDREQPLNEADLPWLEREPSPVHAVVLTEELEQILRRLRPLQRRIFELRLQGQSVSQIALSAQCSERTVHRALEAITQMLQGVRG